jgi:hypothetical protein
MVATVHDDVCAATLGFGPSGYEVTTVELRDARGHTTFVAALPATDDRPRAVWDSSDHLNIVVPDYASFNTLLSDAANIRITSSFEAKSARQPPN